MLSSTFPRALVVYRDFTITTRHSFDARARKRWMCVTSVEIIFEPKAISFFGSCGTGPAQKKKVPSSARRFSAPLTEWFSILKCGKQRKWPKTKIHHRKAFLSTWKEYKTIKSFSCRLSSAINGLFGSSLSSCCVRFFSVFFFGNWRNIKTQSCKRKTCGKLVKFV